MSAEASAGSLSSRADTLVSGSDAGGADAAPSSSNAEPFGPYKPSALFTSPQQRGRIEWFRRQALLQICIAYLEAQLCARDSSYRSHVQKISAFRRRASGLQPSQLEELLRPQLLEPAATCFTDDLQRLQHLLDAPILPNDMGWILGCDGEGQPPKSLLVQRLQTLLARHFGQVLHYKAAANLAMSMLDILASAWYQELLLTTWPLLGEDGQRSLQIWFWRYRLGAQPADLRDDSAEEVVNVAAEQRDPAASSHEPAPQRPRGRND